MSLTMRGRKAQHPAAGIGFTQVELLVVIGIIAVLGAVLLPTVESARNKTRPARAQRSAAVRAEDASVLPEADVDRSTAAEAPPEIRALHLETIDENATLDNQPGQVAGFNPDICPGIPVTPGQTFFGNNGNALPGTVTLCGGQADYFDVWNVFEAPCNGTAKISLCGTGTTFDTTLAVYDSCLERVRTELACNDDLPCGPLGRASQVEIPVVMGRPYFIRVAGFNGARGQYQLDINIACCVNCPTGGTFENESNCGLPSDTTNGGCNTPPGMPPQFTRIGCGMTYCSTAAYDGQLRDTDWYEVVVTTPTQFTWTVTSDFAADIGLVEMSHPGSGNCADHTGNLDPIAQVPSCSTGSVSVCLPPGKHWFFVAPNRFGPAVDCGARYTATLTCARCTLPEACCYPSGECRDGSPSGCLEGLGTPQGPGTICNVNTQCAGPNTGGCCFGDECSIMSLSACMAEGGIYIGDGVPCRPDVCLGQCCMRDALCAYTTPEKCFSIELGGIFWNVFDDCDPNDCPQTGACCIPTGGCLETSRSLCVGNGGRYIGDGTNCSPTICAPPTEACCFATGGCQDMSSGACRESLGTPQGPGTSCATVVCQQPTEACCRNGACTDRPRSACLEVGGTPQGPGTSCTTVTCPLPTGACCAPPQGCTVGASCGAYSPCGGSFNCFCFESAEGGGSCTTAYACAGLTVCPNGTSDCPTGQVCYVDTCCPVSSVCAPPGCLTATADGGTPMGETGAEELTTSGTPLSTVAGLGSECDQLDEPSCQRYGGLYQGDFTQCSPTTCPLPLGACCADGCLIRDRATCESMGGPYLGNGTVCTPTICQPPEACCFVDVACADLLRGMCTAPCPCAPDMNCDGAVNAGDSDAFLLAFTDPVGYQARYPNCNIRAADLDCDGSVNGFDIPIFYCVIGRVCEDLAPVTCADQFGTPQGPGTSCATVNCAPPPEACCFPGGGCEPTTPEVCRRIGGFPQGAGTQCVGDLNGDGIDDVCAVPPCGECGPGPHWIHQPPCPPGGSGQDTLPSGAYGGIDLNNDCIADINLVLGGPVTIGKRGPRDDSAQYPGLRPIDGHLDVIDTEILAMSLTGGGVTLRAGAGQGVGPLRPSTGAIAEDPTDPFVADSFFDVFFEIERGDGLYAYNLAPVRVATRIECLPPDGIYAHITGCIPLYSSPIPGQGTFVGNLVSANHFTYPGCCFGTRCQKDVPTQICEERQGTVVPDCLGDANGNAIDDACECGPAPDGSGCRQSTCPSLIEQCQPRCATLNPASGRTTVTACDCAGTSECHVEIVPQAPPRCAGGCDSTDVCEGRRTPNPDGTVTFCCGCAPPTVVEIDHFEHTVAQMELQGGPGGPELIALDGPTTVHVFFEGPNEGDANDSDGNGLDDVATEMVDMQLTGNSSFGPVVVRLNPARPSLGRIEETVNTQPGRLDLPPFAPSGTANSFFDVFFEIRVGPFVFHTETAKRMSSVIDHKPPGPGTVYENPEKIRLLDANGNLTPYSIGAGRHIPTPVVEIDHFEHTVAQMELQGGPGGPELIALDGPTTVHVFFEGPNEGDANDSDGNGLDEVQTEMVDMQLTGSSPFGPVVVRLNPNIPSRGQIEETANTQPGRLDLPPFAATGTANSFFDVFFEIEVGGVKFHTATPKRMSSVIAHKPPAPGNTYENLEKITLLDENGNPTGFSIGAGRHTPRPPVEIDHFPNTTAMIELQFPQGGSEVIALAGPTTVHVFFEGANEGDANDNDANGLDEVQTEMVDMQLTGNSSFGPVLVRLNPAIPSRGQIEETVNNTPGVLDLPPFAATGTANSFFDVFFEIRVGPFVFHTQTPKRMSSVITHKPPAPGDTYENPEKITLLDENGHPTGFSIGAGRHTPNPALPEACCLPNGTCEVTLADRCRQEGGVPRGPNSQCLGDANDNGIDDACEPEHPCEGCGGFPHWIDQCPGGFDDMPTGALVGIDLGGDCEADVSAVLNGPAHIARSPSHDDSLFYPGLRPIDGHRDVIDTEIVAMELTGGGLTLRAGAGFGHGGVLRPSRGAIAEDPADALLGDSFFDVFFEVDLGGGHFAYNWVPVRVEADVTCLPPQVTYIHVLACIPLFPTPFQRPGVRPVAFLAEARHGAYPTCGSDVTGDCFTPHDTPFCNEGDCCHLVCELVPDCCGIAWSQLCASVAHDVCGPSQACCMPNGSCKEAPPSLCEAASGTPHGEGSTCENTRCPRAGDCNHDGHVDMGDIARFLDCFTGSGGGPVGPECRCADLDADGDVDLADWRIFRELLTTGP